MWHMIFLFWQDDYSQRRRLSTPSGSPSSTKLTRLSRSTGTLTREDEPFCKSSNTLTRDNQRQEAERKGWFKSLSRKNKSNITVNYASSHLTIYINTNINWIWSSKINERDYMFYCEIDESTVHKSQSDRQGNRQSETWEYTPDAFSFFFLRILSDNERSMDRGMVYLRTAK